LGVQATYSAHTNQKDALREANFVIVAFQIGGFEPCTVSDFEVPKKFGLRQTIADTIGIGGIMRGLRTVPHLWKICEDMLELCPNAIMLQYVNPMAINTWAITKKYPEIKQVGLCHSVQHTVNELASDLKIPVSKIHYLSAGINHVSYFLKFEEILDDGSYKDLYPALKIGYEDGIFPRPESMTHARCPNKVRYEMMKRVGYFATESSEHFAEYVPWFIKKDREDIIKKFGIPLDEYPKRCVEQIEEWQNQLKEFASDRKI
jgi:alpha-galactosidase